MKTGKEKPILSTRRRGAGANTTPRSLIYNDFNRSHHCVLLCNDADSSYELYTFPKGNNAAQDDVQSAQRGFARCAVFVARNRFAILDKSKQIWLKTLENETKRKLSIPNVFVNYMFPAGVGRLLLRTTESIILYDVESLKVISELPITSRHPIKYVQWSQGNKTVALMSKANIIICNRKLQELCTVNENSRIKSGGWDSAGVFIYTTSTHIKYVLPNGDAGIIRTLETPVYITAVSNSKISFLDREVKLGELEIDSTEYLFKLALMKRKSKEVLRLMQTNKLVGQSIIAYLQKKGYPEVALHFVQDETIKFSLALECGNIGIALECATRLDSTESWHKLGVEALRQGNHQVVEAAYQKTKNFERLSFLYLITGNVGKLAKMLHIATLRKDLMGRFHNALYLGDVGERVNVLREANQMGLAYLTAKAHGLEETAAEIAEFMGEENVPQLPDLGRAQLFAPLNPILRESNWPLLEVRQSFFDRVDGEDEPEEEEEEEERPMDGDMGADAAPKDDWGGSDLGIDMGMGDENGGGAVADDPWGDLGGLGDLGLDDDLPGGDVGADIDGIFVMVQEGKSARQKWAESSSLAADNIAAGDFKQAMHLLSRQIGVTNFAPLKTAFLNIYSGAHCQLVQLPGVEPYEAALQRGDDLPEQGLKLSHCVDMLKKGYKAVTDGQFATALDSFLSILHMLPLLVVDSPSQVKEVAELLGICREYITAMRIEQARKEAGGDVGRQAALAAYFTQCNLQAVHLALGLRVAIKQAYTAKNFKMTAGFCRRMLELCQSSTNATIQRIVNLRQIKTVLVQCEKTPTDAVPVDYDDTMQWLLCCDSLTPITQKQKDAPRCPYCASAFQPHLMGQLCNTCQLSKVGAQASGLKNIPDSY